MLVWSLDWEDPLQEGMATHSSTLAWSIPWTEEPGTLWSTGSHKVRLNWSDSARTAGRHYILRYVMCFKRKFLLSYGLIVMSRSQWVNVKAQLWNPGFLFPNLEFCVSESVSHSSCPTLCDPTDCSPPGSSVHGIFQAMILEWVAMP